MTNNTSDPFVSVVTPVYNAEEFISECIESVLAQTYQNFEYLIVNNCSTDRTLEIIQKYADMDSRIRIHNNVTFLTSLQNQNYAMTLIPENSKYCKVVHADDWLYPECIKKMVKIAESDSSIGIVSSFILQGSKVHSECPPSPSHCRDEQYPFQIFTGRDICRIDIYNSGTNVFGNPSRLLIRSNLIKKNEPFYDERHIFMDVDICYKILQKSKFAYIYQVLSYMRKHEAQLHSFLDKVNGYIACRFYLLTKYGKIYLEENEYKNLVYERLKEYHLFLKYNSLKKINFKKDKNFWDYHLQYLRLSGFPISKITLAKFVTSRFLDIFLNPKRTMESIYKRLL